MFLTSDSQHRCGSWPTQSLLQHFDKNPFRKRRCSLALLAVGETEKKDHQLTTIRYRKHCEIVGEIGSKRNSSKRTECPTKMKKPLSNTGDDIQTEPWFVRRSEEMTSFGSRNLPLLTEFLLNRIPCLEGRSELSKGEYNETRVFPFVHSGYEETKMLQDRQLTDSEIFQSLGILWKKRTWYLCRKEEKFFRR